MGILNVAIADDNERMVEILDSIVKKDDEIRIVGKANNGEDVYHMIKEKERLHDTAGTADFAVN